MFLLINYSIELFFLTDLNFLEEKKLSLSGLDFIVNSL